MTIKHDISPQCRSEEHGLCRRINLEGTITYVCVCVCHKELGELPDDAK